MALCPYAEGVALRSPGSRAHKVSTANGDSATKTPPPRVARRMNTSRFPLLDAVTRGRMWWLQVRTMRITGIKERLPYAADEETESRLFPLRHPPGCFPHPCRAFSGRGCGRRPFSQENAPSVPRSALSRLSRYGDEEGWPRPGEVAGGL